MILIGLGGNLPTTRFGPPRATLEAALGTLAEHGVRAISRSRWYRSAPVPDDGSPWYTNGVALVETEFESSDLLRVLLETEAAFGRRRERRNAPRVLDLDLLAYHEHATWGGAATGAAPPDLPHPRMHERAFVLLPLAEVAPGWRHPALGRTVEELIEALPPGQHAAPLPDAPA
jgi:2-amino-4-hydroxy-6-hydroxymethyldihydropteridine diphosphokinase